MTNMIQEPTKDPASGQPIKGPGNENQSVSINTSQLVGLCAAGLAVCFFLPWIQILFGKPSGFDFAKQGEEYLLLWSIPILSAITVIAGMAKLSQKVVAQMTGAVPFIVLGIGLYHIGKDLLKVLEIGAYAGLALGLVMFIIARRLK
jgi:hypothetical protein